MNFKQFQHVLLDNGFVYNKVCTDDVEEFHISNSQGWVGTWLLLPLPEEDWDNSGHCVYECTSSGVQSFYTPNRPCFYNVICDYLESL